MELKTFFVLSFIIVFNLNAKEISISFDDAPRGNTQYFSGMERTNTLIKELKKSNIDRVAFYINTIKLDKDNGLERIKKYRKAGHLIGNHTHSHPNIKEIEASNYVLDFDKADKILKKHNLLDKYFRYPYLRRGKSLPELNYIYDYINDKGYKDAFVTVDNYDFYMDYLFQKLLKEKRTINFENLKNFYVETLYKGIIFYNELAIKALGQEVKQVLLLHENDLAALFIGDLVKHLRVKGWKIISPEDSYSDPITKKFPRDILLQGSGRVNALAQKAGYQGPLISGFEDESVLEKLLTDYKVFK